MHVQYDRLVVDTARNLGAITPYAGPSPPPAQSGVHVSGAFGPQNRRDDDTVGTIMTVNSRTITSAASSLVMTASLPERECPVTAT